jgi:excisionase family DNA binding protein
MREKVSRIFPKDEAELAESNALAGILGLIESVVERRVRPLEERLESVQVQTIEAEEYLDAEALSKRIHTEVKTIRDWVHKKKIPFEKMPTGGIRFPWSKVEAWLKGAGS